jgi:hypothetical protein
MYSEEAELMGTVEDSVGWIEDEVPCLQLTVFAMNSVEVVVHRRCDVRMFADVKGAKRNTETCQQ